MEPPKRFVEKLSLTPEMTVVDFGCGPGFFTVELAKHAGRVVGVDLQADMLKKARRKTEKAGVQNVEFLQSDGASLQLPDASVDLIMLYTVFHEIADPDAAIKEFHRILKPSGRLVIVEVIKKHLIPGAPIQNSAELQAKVEADGYKLQTLTPYRLYGIFFFTKKAPA